MSRATREEWRVRVAKFASSGLTTKAFAAQEGLNPSTLAWWKGQLQAEEPVSFVEVAPLPVHDPRLEVVVGQAVVRVPVGADRSTLALVLDLLEGRR